MRPPLLPFLLPTLLTSPSSSPLAHASPAPAPASAAPPLQDQPWSVQMSTSILSKSQYLNPHYVAAVLYEGLQRTATLHSNTTLLNHVSTSLSSLVTQNGTLIDFRPDFYSLDELRIGNNILFFHQHPRTTPSEKSKYRTAAQTLRNQLNVYPRTPTGGFWHRSPTYPNQMWLDGIYMASTFYATYTSLFEPSNVTAWNDIVHQFDLIESHTRVNATGLLKHGYDESKKAVWADPVTGECPHVWIRAVGWYFMALLDVIEVYPKSLPGYARLVGYYTTVAEAVRKSWDEGQGGWWLVMGDEYVGKEGNYIESSGSAMFVYGMLRGLRVGLLKESDGYREVAEKGYKTLVDRFVTREKNGTVSWEGTVVVGSLGSNGSYEYYVSMKLARNDGKGVGPFLFASTEMEMYQKSLEQAA